MASAALVAIAIPLASIVAHEGNNSATTIHACVSTSGVVKIVAANSGPCVKPDRALHWGIVGPAGANGLDGEDGADGADGAPGADGADGAPGADGVDGEDGAPGADGEDGAPGADGVDGVDGEDGAPGADGADGAPGADGANGVAGLATVASATTRSSSTTEDVLVEATATCAAGKVVVGGGAKIDTSNTAIRSQVVMFRSFPLTANSWQGAAVITSGFSGQSVTVTAYAICADAS